MYEKIIGFWFLKYKNINVFIKNIIFVFILFIIYVGGYTHSYRNRTQNYIDKYNDPNYKVTSLKVKTLALGYKNKKTSEENPNYDKFAVFDNDYNEYLNILLKRNENIYNYKDIGKYNIISIINGKEIVFYKRDFIVEGVDTTTISKRIPMVFQKYFENIQLFFKNIKNETFSIESAKKLNFMFCKEFIISYIALIFLTFHFHKNFIYNRNLYMWKDFKIFYMPTTHLSLIISIVIVCMVQFFKAIGIMSNLVTQNILASNIIKIFPPIDTIYIEVLIMWIIVRAPIVSLFIDFYKIFKNKNLKYKIAYCFMITFSNFLIYMLLFTSFVLKLALISSLVFFVFMYYLFYDNIKKFFPSHEKAKGQPV